MRTIDFTVIGGGGGGTVGTSWTCPYGLSVTLTVPSGSRSIQFTGQMVNTGSASPSQSLNYGIRVGGNVTTLGAFSATSAGQTFAISFAQVVSVAAGSVTFEIIGSAGVNSALLNGQFIIL